MQWIDDDALRSFWPSIKGVSHDWDAISSVEYTAVFLEEQFYWISTSKYTINSLIKFISHFLTKISNCSSFFCKRYGVNNLYSFCGDHAKAFDSIGSYHIRAFTAKVNLPCEMLTIFVGLWTKTNDTIIYLNIYFAKMSIIKTIIYIWWLSEHFQGAGN